MRVRVDQARQQRVRGAAQVLGRIVVAVGLARPGTTAIDSSGVDDDRMRWR